MDERIKVTNHDARVSERTRGSGVVYLLLEISRKESMKSPVRSGVDMHRHSNNINEIHPLVPKSLCMHGKVSEHEFSEGQLRWAGVGAGVGLGVGAGRKAWPRS